MIKTIVDDFIRVANVNDIQPSQMKEVQIDGEDVYIVNVDGNTMQLAMSVHTKMVL
jgi:hypothetical protein